MHQDKQQAGERYEVPASPRVAGVPQGLRCSRADGLLRPSFIKCGRRKLCGARVADAWILETKTIFGGRGSNICGDGEVGNVGFLLTREITLRN